MIPALRTLFAAVIDNCDPGTGDCQTNLPTIDATPDTAKIVLQLVFGIIAVVTVIYIIISAIRFQTSLGNPEATAKLRNSVIWAAVGLVVALAAEVLVTFTIQKV